MDWIIKRASALSAEEQAARGITGIPQDWPIEQYPYNDTVPDGFEQISSEDLDLLRINNQVYYDAWYYSLQPLAPTPSPQEVVVSSMPSVVILGPVDTDGAQLTRLKVNRSGWHFEPRMLSWRTAKVKSLFNRKSDGHTVIGGTDYGDATIKFYNASGTLLTQGVDEQDADFQTRLTEGCTQTCVDWQPHYDMEMIAGAIMLGGCEGKTAYGWCTFAPDIPAAYGGSVPFMSGGLDLSMFISGDIHMYDGRVPKLMAYDPVYNSNKIRIQILHETGVQIAAMIRYEHFKE